MGWIAHRDVVHPYIAVNERGEEGGVVTHRGRGMVVQRRLCVHHCVALAICSPVCGRWWLCVCQSAYWERYARMGHTFIRAKDGLAAIGDGALEDLLHRRQVVTVRVGLRVPEPLMGHKIEANVPICAGKSSGRTRPFFTSTLCGSSFLRVRKSLIFIACAGKMFSCSSGDCPRLSQWPA